MRKKLTNKRELNFILLLLLINTTLGYGIDFNDDTISNQLIINQDGAIGINQDGNGVDRENIILNNGIISGNIKLTSGFSTESGDTTINKSGNGLYGNIENNNGVILGDITLLGGNSSTLTSISSAVDSGNGIYGNVKNNNGVILGSGNLVAGKVTTNSNIIVKAISSADYGGNGINGNIENNNGVVLGSLVLKGGNAVSNSTSSATNYAISATTKGGNGIRGNLKENNGAISGNVISSGGTATATSNSNKNVTAIAYSSSDYSGNGLYGNAEMNNGIISGNLILTGGTSIATSTNPLTYASIAYSNVNSEGSGNGISAISIEKKINNGVISGYLLANAGVYNGKKDYEKIFYSGNGIGTSSNLSGTINNNGVIKGSQSAIAASSIDGLINNYGILAGREIFSDGREIIKNESFESQKNLGKIVIKNENNQGIYVKLKSEMSGGNTTGKVELDNNGNPIIESIEIGLGGSINGKEILNGGDVGNIIMGPVSIAGIHGNIDTYLNSSNLSREENLIINATGISKGALVIDKDIKLKDSIVNGYNTAVYLEDNSQLIATNVIFNGGGLKNNIAVIKGGSGNSTLHIEGDSIINGKIELGAGNDILSIENSVLINDDIDGGLGIDTLNLGNKSLPKENKLLSIYHEIKGFEEINTNGNITLFETANINEGNINIESGNLTLRVNPNEKDSNGYIIGHALYNHSGDITAVGGNLIIGLNGLGEDSIIATNGTLIDKNIDTVYDEEANKLRTNSLVLNATLLNDDNIKITVFEDIPSIPNPPTDPLPPVDSPSSPTVIDSVLYKHLNKVYKSIVSAGEIGKLANTTLLEGKTYNESLGGLLTMLDQIYANNPYAYTLKSSRDSLKLFEDNMSYLTIKPQKHELIAQGKAIYTGVKNDNTASGKNYYGFDTGHRNYNTTTSTTGGLATFEYGLSDKTSAGVVVGGNNQNVNFKGSSKIEGDSLYLGTFAKTEVNNFRFMGGIGYQYTSADADRRVSNGYDSFKTNEKYDINSYNAFVEAKYVYEGTQNWRIEPKTRLSYYYIDQGKIDEGYKPGQLSIGVDEANSKTADLEVGVDVVKTVQLEKGKLNNIFSLGVINTLGSDSKELKGHVIGENKKGSKFDIQGTELPRTSGKASYNLELEQANGMIYTAGVSLEFSKDYNRNVNATVGIGYKF